MYLKHSRGGSRGRVQGVRTLPWDDLRFSNTIGILQKKKTMWFIGVEVAQETSAPPPKKNPGSAPVSFIGYVPKPLSYYAHGSVLNNRLPNNTQITTNNMSGLLCRSRPLRFIEDQLSLKNRIVKNTSRKITRSFGYVSTRDTRRPGKTSTKNPRETGKK